MRRHAIATALLLLLAPLARAAPVTVAIADFGYVDSSGEPRDQSAAHARRLQALQASITAALTKAGFHAVPLACATPPCTADALDQDGITAAARRQGAPVVVFGGVHKISTLIEFGHVDVMDVASGRALLSREVQFRGDTDEAWTHAADYIAGMVADTIRK